VSGDPQTRSTGQTVLMPYWDRVASQYAAADPLGAVCYPAAPSWFNRFYARFQLRAVERFLGPLPLAGLQALDVGCGSGRWSRWLAARGAQVVGVDPTSAMLETARALSPGVSFEPMSATALDFPPDRFDLVLAVTVIQHLQPAEQEQAAAAMARVVRPGGMLFVFDLIDRRDPGRQVFPRTPADWIALYGGSGLELVRWEGQEFVPLMRALTAALRLWRRPSAAASEVTAPSLLEQAGRRRAAFLPLWPLVQLSHPLEVLCERWLPATWARHGCFLFRKPTRGADMGERPSSSDPRSARRPQS
jgi:2-polyprenyl-3-methyl-5-hydroxy-6-metoxy-1,4-benzoquinol methylase